MTRSVPQPPSQYICPLTKELMKEPVMSKYGHHYERTAILKHLAMSNYCPMTGHPLHIGNLIPNKTLQWKIQYWAKIHGVSDKTTMDNDQAAKQIGSLNSVPPARFLCPLSGQVMRDPVMTKNGANFERKAIIKWLSSLDQNVCPVTSTPLTVLGLIPNSKLQQEIEQWEQAHGKPSSGGDSTKKYVIKNAAFNNKTLSGAVSRNMSLASSLIHSSPIDTIATSSSPIRKMSKQSLLDALDTAIAVSGSRGGYCFHNGLLDADKTASNDVTGEGT